MQISGGTYNSRNITAACIILFYLHGGTMERAAADAVDEMIVDNHEELFVKVGNSEGSTVLIRSACVEK